MAASDAQHPAAHDDSAARLHQLEAQLAEALAREERYRLLSAAALEGILIHDQGIILDANLSLATMLGYTVDELVGTDALRLATPAFRPTVRQMIVSGYEGAYQGEGQRRDGSTFPAEIVARRIAFQGRPVRLAIIRDISERLRNEQDLRRSELRYRMLAENATDVIWTMNRAGRFTYVSPSVERLRGYTPEEVMAQTLDQVLTPGSVAIVRAQLALLSGGRQPADWRDQRFELEQPCKDGTTVWTEVTTNLLYDEDGQVSGVIGVSRDITERRRIQGLLQQERALLRTLIDNLPDSVYVKDLAGRFLLNNAESLRRMGVHTQADTLGRVSGDFFPAEVVEIWDAVEQDVMRTGEMRIEEEQVTRPNGELRWVRAMHFPLHDEHGAIIGMVGVNQDITEQKEAEEQRFALALERERSAMLERFIGDASHDLKNPLTAMKMSLAVLQRTNDDEKRRQHFEILWSRVSALERTLDDLLNLTRLDRDLQLQVRRLSLSRLASTLVEARQSMALEKRQTLVCKCDESGELPVEGDPAKLRRALDMFVINALNYTPEGGTITVRLARSGRQAVLSVEDTGIGISPHDLPFIFNRFYRADPARQTDTGGMGVGLTIARLIIEAHHGWIKAESEAGKGSAFFVYLPLAE